MYDATPNPKIAGELAAFEIPHLVQTEESDLHLLTRLALAHDAITAIQIFVHTVTSPIQVAIFAIALASLYLWKWCWSVPVMILGCGILGYVINFL